VHADDYELLADAIRIEHESASATGVRYVEQTALRIAIALCWQNHRFDPMKFMLNACDVESVEGLSPEVARELLDLTGGRDRPRRRAGTEQVAFQPPDTSRWHEGLLIGAVIFGVNGAVGGEVSGHAASTTVRALVNAGIHTLGEMLAKSDEELLAIPRIGPRAMQFIHAVRAAWNAKQEGEIPDV
jgi:hypothetical protein